MSALTMNPAGLPHRKPVPGYASGPQPGFMSVPAPPPQYAQPGPSRQPVHMRTASGNTINGNPAPPVNMAAAAPQYSMAQQQPQQRRVPVYGQPARRTLSSATSSTSSTSTNTGLQRAPTNTGFNGASAPRRSTSSRSTASASPTSYVALMRKQKATVWCDRAQHEDPRILAAQRAAKMRAAMDVAGSQSHINSGRASTSSQGMVGGVRSKIRHHGAPKASTYSGGPNMSGAGVPMRLSASEVDEGDSDEEPEARYMNKMYHSRNGSGRSSLGSGHRMTNSYLNSTRGYSNGSTPPNGHSPVESMGDLLEEETPMPGQYGEKVPDYFAQPGGQGGSGSSGEREEKFGAVGVLPKRTEEQVKKSEDELRRRGSVDDRTMTMSGVRLFVANPDLSD